MTAISSILSTPLGQTRSAPVNPLRATALALQRAAPSSFVTVSKQGAAAARQATPLPPAVAADPGKPADVGALVASNFNAPSLAGKFGGLGVALLGQFKGEGAVAAVSASMQAAPPVREDGLYGPAAPGAAAVAAAAGAAGVGESQVSLTVTTAGGVKVSLSLESREGALAVRMSSSAEGEDELSSNERAALAGLADAFQQAIDGMAEEPPKLRLEGLTRFDTSALASVDLRASVQLRSEPGKAQTVDFHADAAQRKVSLGGPSGAATVTVDTSKPESLGSGEQQAKALGSYLKQVDQAVSRGHGDPVLAALFKDAFTGMHGNATAPDAPSAGLDGPASGAGYAQFGKVQLSAGDHAALTGLADFSATMTQSPEALNPMRPGETDNFAYQVSQDTAIGGRTQGERSISQQQKSELKASYHTPLVPGAALMLDSDPKSQNYNYHQIDDSASSQLDLAYREGRMVRASLNQSATQSARVRQYAMGTLVSDITTPGQKTLQRDLLAALAPYRSGEHARTEEQRSAQREQVLLGLSDQVLLQAYPEPVSGAWGDAAVDSLA